MSLQTGKSEPQQFKEGELLCRIWREHFYLYKLIEAKDEDEEIETIIKVHEKELLKR